MKAKSLLSVEQVDALCKCDNVDHLVVKQWNRLLFPTPTPTPTQQGQKKVQPITKTEGKRIVFVFVFVCIFIHINMR